MNRLIIIGAGGHGKVVADNALKNGYTNICYIDDNAKGDVIGFPIIGTSTDIECLNDGSTDFIIGIGNNAVRKMIAEKYRVNWVTLIHPSAQIAFNAEIGKGSVVMANAVVNVCAKIGEHCIINTGAIVEHDNVIEDYVHISPNAALGGTVHIGDNTHVGIGATVKNNINVCSECTIGAGAVVVKNITDNGTYIGVPARKMD
ncbi:MAG: acetyltransferase [Clostridia bacterium]|nr:acetyltransferase [Clostridia bacterium]